VSSPVEPDTTGLREGGSENEAFESPFYRATLIFQRARQLQSGARPRVDSRGHSLTRVALLEVLAGLVGR
jgi:DNA-directed RNA polymerase subunit K/omega